VTGRPASRQLRRSAGDDNRPKNTDALRETRPPERLAVIALDDADYERLNLERDVVAPWEDGAPTDNRRGTYQWWYFVAHLDDGSSLVVVFMKKDLAAPNDPLTPTIDIDLADGRSYQKLVTYAPESWQTSTSGADVRCRHTSGARGSRHAALARLSGRARLRERARPKGLTHASPAERCLEGVGIAQPIDTPN
jgi:hypothetical protein